MNTIIIIVFSYVKTSKQLLFLTWDKNYNKSNKVLEH